MAFADLLPAFGDKLPQRICGWERWRSPFRYTQERCRKLFRDGRLETSKGKNPGQRSDKKNATRTKPLRELAGETEPARIALLVGHRDTSMVERVFGVWITSPESPPQKGDDLRVKHDVHGIGCHRDPNAKRPL